MQIRELRFYLPTPSMQVFEIGVKASMSTSTLSQITTIPHMSSFDATIDKS